VYCRDVVTCPHCAAELPPVTLFIPSEVAPLDGQAKIRVPVGLLAQARLDLKKARGHLTATREAVLRYCSDGLCNGIPSHLLLSWLFSWPNERDSVLSQIGYSARARRELLEMLEKITVQEVLSFNGAPPAASPAVSPAKPVDEDRIMAEARARILWGELSSSVREFLTASGLPAAVVNTKIEEFSRERNAWIRKAGVKSILTGTLVAALAGVVVWLIAPLSGLTRALCVLWVLGAYALWKIVNGIIYLVRPQSEQRGMQEIAASGSIE
jgi:hypothetical protein